MRNQKNLNLKRKNSLNNGFAFSHVTHATSTQAPNHGLGTPSLSLDFNSFEKADLSRQHIELEKFQNKTNLKGNVDFVFSQVWKFVISPINLTLSFAQIHKNKGSTTPGVDGLNVDGIGIQYLQELRNDLVANKYEHAMIKRVFIPKPNSTKKRPLGIPTFRDRIVQCAVKNVLESIFEPRFKHLEKEHNKSCRNYGFRPGVRPQEAILSLRTAIPNHTNVIELDIEGAFNNLSHKKILSEISLRINDKRLMALIQQMLKAKIMFRGKKETPYVGTPQGSILSPLLWNIGFESFDNFIRTDLQEYLNTINKNEKRLKPATFNPEYGAIGNRRRRRKYKIKKITNEEMTPKKLVSLEKAEKEFKELSATMRKTRSTLRRTESKIKAFRYADDVLILHEGPDHELYEIKDRIFRFLKSLGLTASTEKTSIHKLTDKLNITKFIGFQLLKRDEHQVTAVNRQQKNGEVFRFKRRSTPGTLVQPDMTRILTRLESKGLCYTSSKGRSYFPKHSNVLALKSEFEIVTWYRQVLQGLLGYYTPVSTTRSFLYRISYILRFSCAKTIALKRRCSIKKVFDRNTRNLNVNVTKMITNVQTNETNSKVYYVSLPDAKTSIDLAEKNWFEGQSSDLDPFKIYVNLRTVLKLTNECTRCGAIDSPNNPLELHHKNAYNTIKSSGFEKFVISLNRKVIPLCRHCHLKATNGKLNDIKFSDLQSPDNL